MFGQILAKSQRGNQLCLSGRGIRGIPGAWPLKGCSWPPVQADTPTVAPPRAGVGQPCPRPASCQKVGACRAPDFVPRAAGHFGQNATDWDAWDLSRPTNRMFGPTASGDEDDAAMARGCSPDDAQAPAAIRKWRLSEPIWGWGKLGLLSAQACEKGHTWPRLHHRRDEAQDRHASC